MAISCELCGGKLIMRAGGIATCDICGLEYSLERMRELLNMSAPQPIHTEQKATASNVDDDIFSFDAPAPAHQAEVRLDNSPIGALATVIDAVIEKKKAEEAEDIKASAPAMDDDIFDLFGNDAPANQPKDASESPSPASDASEAKRLIGLAETNIEFAKYDIAIELCDKAIEADPQCYNAFKLKAICLCAVYPDGKTKIYDIGNLFSAAEEFAPEEERPSIRKTAERELSVAANRTVTNMADEFIRWPDTPFFTAVKGITQGVRAFTDDVEYMDSILADFSVTVTETVEEAFNEKIIPDYKGADMHPNQIKANKFLPRADLCIEILEQLIPVHSANKKILIPVYELLINICKEKAECAHWSYESQGVSSMKIWMQHHILSKPVRATIHNKIKEYKEDIFLLDPDRRPLTPAEKRKLAAERYEKYWKEHAQDREDLLKEQELIRTRINEHRRSINLLPAYKEETEMTALINKLTVEKNKLSVFRNTERSAIQSQIDDCEIKLRRAREELYVIKEGIDRKIRELEDEIEDINHELTRER